MQARSPAGARRYIAQSGCYYYRTGDGLANESEPWVEHGPPLVAGGVGALTAVEQRTLRPNGPLAGVALRYGFFYGPGTWSHPDGDVAAQLRAGRYPVLGTGAGRWSFVHIDDAVAATVAAVEFTSPARSTSVTTSRSRSAGGCPPSPSTWARAVAAARADRAGHRPGRPLLRRAATRRRQPPRPQGTRFRSPLPWIETDVP